MGTRKQHARNRSLLVCPPVPIPIPSPRPLLTPHTMQASSPPSHSGRPLHNSSRNGPKRNDRRTTPRPLPRIESLELRVLFQLFQRGVKGCTGYVLVWDPDLHGERMCLSGESWIIPLVWAKETDLSVSDVESDLALPSTYAESPVAHG